MTRATAAGWSVFRSRWQELGACTRARHASRAQCPIGTHRDQEGSGSLVVLGAHSIGECSRGTVRPTLDEVVDRERAVRFVSTTSDLLPSSDGTQTRISRSSARTIEVSNAGTPVTGVPSRSDAGRCIPLDRTTASNIPRVSRQIRSRLRRCFVLSLDRIQMDLVECRTSDRHDEDFPSSDCCAPQLNPSVQMAHLGAPTL